MSGTPPQPATVTTIVPPGPTDDENPPIPERVSRIRTGVTPVNTLPVAAGTLASVNQPLTSAMICTLPPGLKKATRPPAPSITMTRFATACPPREFRFDASGTPVPAGKTVRYPAGVGEVTVTLRTTAEAPVAGTPPRPVTCSVSV